jgi:hypothetical protein
MSSADLRLHSRYDPAREAARFVDSCGIRFNPFCVVVTEPGESYLSPALRERFPSAILVALRYDQARFSDSDSRWDAVWRPGTDVALPAFLFNIIPDECLPLTVFLPWKPADDAWPIEAKSVWRDIASVIRTQASVMHTRDHFGRRWFSNMIRNAALACSFVTVERDTLPIILAAAGPSLERLPAFPRRSFRVYAVSAAVSALLDRGITPDLCIATDGGFWARDHFRAFPEGVPVAFPLEAAIPSDILEHNPVALLDYGSLLERELCFRCGLNGAKASRNGTVAGTAALFALSRTEAPVYASGLDLAPSDSFTHARPHVSDNPLSASAWRLKPLSASLFERNLETASLDMYAAWFSSRDSAFRNRFFRLAPSFRQIDGVKTVGLPAAATGTAARNGEGLASIVEASQCTPCAVPDRPTRKARIAAWLAELTAAISPFSDSWTDFETYDAFIGGMFRDPLWVEIFQLVSYTDYIGALKNAGSTGGTRTEDVSRARALCAKTQAFLGKLSATVHAYG